MADNTDQVQPTRAHPTRTTCGKLDGYDYQVGFQFSADFPVPSVYVVMDGCAYFRGPDGHLWSVGVLHTGNPYIIDWRYPQNVADAYLNDMDMDYQEYEGVTADLCTAIDAMASAAVRSDALETDRLG